LFSSLLCRLLQDPYSNLSRLQSRRGSTSCKPSSSDPPPLSTLLASDADTFSPIYFHHLRPIELSSRDLRRRRRSTKLNQQPTTRRGKGRRRSFFPRRRGSTKLPMSTTFLDRTETPSLLVHSSEIGDPRSVPNSLLVQSRRGSLFFLSSSLLFRST